MYILNRVVMGEPQDAQPEPPLSPAARVDYAGVNYITASAISDGQCPNRSGTYVFLEDCIPEHASASHMPLVYEVSYCAFLIAPFQLARYFPRKSPTERPFSSQPQDVCLHKSIYTTASGDGSFSLALLLVPPLPASHRISSHLIWFLLWVYDYYCVENHLC
jgi:hypothetical protein